MPASEALPAPPRRLDALFTPGQRWSSAVIGLVALALAFAQPADRVDMGLPLASGESPTTIVEAIPPAAFVPAPDLGAAPVPSPPAPVGGSAGGDFVIPPAPPNVVALVAGDRIPGRGDAAIAAAFLETAPFKATVMPIPNAPDATFCGKVASAGPVAIASLGLALPLRDCLVKAGVVLVSFDTNGGSPDKGGPVVSTRRGIGGALDDLTTWAKRSEALKGKVGVVGTTSARGALDAAVARMRAAGVDVAATAYIGDDATVGSDTSEGTRAFATAGVQVVVFAAPVAQQRQWVAQQAVLLPGVRYVVADAYDAVTDEGYPPMFEGAVAHTSTRVPWFARDHEETPAQRDCRSRWESKATPPTTLDNTELVTVFAWCQHVALLAMALEAQATSGTTGFAEMIRTIRFTSPLTSDVGPSPNGRYGPVQDAVLVWQASCSCWKEKAAFADR